MKLKTLFCFGALQHLINSLLKPPFVIFEREVERITMNWLHIAEYEAGFVRYSQAHIERQPRFANLRLASNKGDTLGNKLGQNNAYRLELLRLKFVGGN